MGTHLNLGLSLNLSLFLNLKDGQELNMDRDSG